MLLSERVFQEQKNEGSFVKIEPTVQKLREFEIKS